jgi:hypothetical protein
MADPVALINAFDTYLKGVPATGSHVLTMPLVALRGITSESINAGGQVTIDLSTVPLENPSAVVDAVRRVVLIAQAAK